MNQSQWKVNQLQWKQQVSKTAIKLLTICNARFTIFELHFITLYFIVIVTTFVSFFLAIHKLRLIKLLVKITFGIYNTMHYHAFLMYKLCSLKSDVNVSSRKSLRALKEDIKEV